MAGRYNAEEHLRRLLRPSRCAGRVRFVGASREGRGSSRCRAAGSGRAASTSMQHIWTSLPWLKGVYNPGPGPGT